MNMKKGRISEFEDRTIEFTHPEERKQIEKKMSKASGTRSITATAPAFMSSSPREEEEESGTGKKYLRK